MSGNNGWERSKSGTEEAVRTVRDLAIGVTALFGIATTAFPLPRPVESVQEEVKQEWLADIEDGGMQIPYFTGDLEYERFEAEPSAIEESIEEGEEHRREWMRSYDRFVDPGPFESLAEDIYNTNETDEERIRQVWRFVSGNVEYELDETISSMEEGADIPLMPLETLYREAGDCEDVAIVAASILEAMPADWDVDLVEMDRSDPERIPFVTDHVAVYVETGEYSTFIEATSDFEMNPYDRYSHAEVLDGGELRTIGTRPAPTYMP